MKNYYQIRVHGIYEREKLDVNANLIMKDKLRPWMVMPERSANGK